ncbi:MAG: cysteine-rich CWC family protein [Aquabacterium sp.]|nr:MAG: cysteine-rich CWC family protein [Aquabacterium sp.]
MLKPLPHADATSTPPCQSLCPLCGQANACAQAAGCATDTPCWCQKTTFSAALLARVPQVQRGMACICANCVNNTPPKD